MKHFLNQSPIINVLFVCMGNICRSPAAEIIFRNMVDKNQMNEQIHTDSAGTIGYHEGSPPDSRMLKTLANHGYSIFPHRARKIKPEDLEQFDLILTMDGDNFTDVRAMDKLKRFRDKIIPMCKFVSNKFRDTEVPDPYYGGQSGFDHVVELLEDACSNLLKSVKGTIAKHNTAISE